MVGDLSSEDLSCTTAQQIAESVELRPSQRLRREVIAMSDGSDTESVHSVRGEAVRARPRRRLVIVSQPDQEVLSDNDTESVDGAQVEEVLRWNPDAV